MVRRRSRLPKGARTAGRLLRVLGVSGTGTIAVICLVVSLLMIGSDYTSTASEQNACKLPDLVDGPGVEIFGDSALTGLSKVQPARLAGGRVRADVHRGRTAEQAVNELANLPDSAPSTFVVSLELDDPGEVASYTNEIDELSLLLSDRRVLWVAMPGKTALTKVVEAANTGDRSGWQIIDLAQAADSHHGLWNGHSLTAPGRKALATTITSTLASTTTPTSTAMSTNSAITVSSSTTGERFAVTGDRKHNAEAILQAGTGLSVPQRGLVIGVAVAIQESRLVNLTSGDQDSVGLFQQRPLQGWGTHKQLLNPQYAATQFFTRLLQVPGWQQMSLTDAAQAVQRSGLPNAYAQWESSATTIVAALQGKQAPGCGVHDPTASNPKAQVAVQAALSNLGVPYAWGGGDINGPTRGVCTPGAGWNDCHIVGFDCSGLMLYAWGQAGIAVPHHTPDMWSDAAFTHIARDQLQPGDMVMFQTNGVPEHTGMYLGNNDMVHAPESGDVVRTVSLSQPWYQQHYLGALRPKD